MNSWTRLSEKGQIVLPKDVRDRLGWRPGTDFEVIEHGGSVTLRPVATRPTLTVAQLVARLAEINPNPGPKMTDEEMRDAVLTMAARQNPPPR